MVAVSEIGWGRYRNFEGPFYKGKHGFKLPANPTETDRTIAVITATEGGHFDAWNGYDVCGWTSGLIQWCERGQYSVSDMLGTVVETVGRDALVSVFAACDASSVTFKRNLRNRWRFHFTDSRGEVDRLEEQQALFYINGDGTQGSWTDGLKFYAKSWAAAISTVWETPQAQRAQLEYTAARLTGFMTASAKKLFLESRPQHALANMLQAAYLSFAANNPTWASNSLKRATDTNAHLGLWTLPWTTAILKELTFGPKVAIYPHRYNAIRPVLEKLYGVELPDFAAELADWHAATGIPKVVTTRQIQQGLISLGYDLGPSGADNIYGKKTREAVLTLEQLSGMVPAEHQDGMVDIYTWPALQKALADKGLPPVEES